MYERYLGVQEDSSNRRQRQQHERYVEFSKLIGIKASTGVRGGGGYFGVKRIGMTVGTPRKLP